MAKEKIKIEVNKMSFYEMRDLMLADKIEYAVIVISNKTWEKIKKSYSLEERSYLISKKASWGLQSGKISHAIYGNSIVGNDNGVRLDRYINFTENDDKWIVDYCYELNESQYNALSQGEPFEMIYKEIDEIEREI